MKDDNENIDTSKATGLLVLSHGSYYWGYGCGAQGETQGEICFNTSVTGYQEIITDPSYAGQIINFTMPHIGNVGVNDEDFEALLPQAKGVVMNAKPTAPSNYRSELSFHEWLERFGIIGLYGIDTRALTQDIRSHGGVGAILCHTPSGNIDLRFFLEQARTIASLEGIELTQKVGARKGQKWQSHKGGLWSPKDGYGSLQKSRFHVVAIDYGMKHALSRQLTAIGAEVTLVPPFAHLDDILSLEPDGVFLSNGPGDPHATSRFASATICGVIEKNIPLFGVCLGHQLLALALGAKTKKMTLGHRGGNHPVRVMHNGRVEITSQNHGFVVEDDNLPSCLEVTHRSLFDGSIEGIRLKDKPIFAVQYHPEASPGPHDASYLFGEFARDMREHKKA